MQEFWRGVSSPDFFFSLFKQTAIGSAFIITGAFIISSASWAEIFHCLGFSSKGQILGFFQQNPQNILTNARHILPLLANDSSHAICHLIYPYFLSKLDGLARLGPFGICSRLGHGHTQNACDIAAFGQVHKGNNTLIPRIARLQPTHAPLGRQAQHSPATSL